MQRSSEDGQTAGPGEPTKEPSHPLGAESSQDTLVVSEKKFVTLEDFDYVDFADAEFSDDEIKEFKQLFLGWKLPPKPETVSDEKLRSLGYKGPNPWVTYYLEQRILNS